MKPRKAFVAVFMPFSPAFADVWNGGIKRAVDSCNLECRRLDGIPSCGCILGLVRGLLEDDRCYGAIVDVTDHRPDVMIELGAALSELTWKRDKPLVIISQDTRYLSADICHLKTIIYSNTWLGIETLRAELCDHLQARDPCVAA